MSWLFSQVLVEEFSEDICLDGEPSAQSNGSRIQQAYLSQDKMTDFSRLSRFGMTYKPLTEDHGEALLTLYRAAFHAKTLVPPEEAKASTESDQECGEKWRGSFTKWDQDSSSWKTHQYSLLEDLESFSETWPQWGLMRDGECWEQFMSVPRICANESGFVPNDETFFNTPRTTGLDGGANSRRALQKRKEMWPTPATKGYGHAAEGMVANLIQKIEDGIISKQEAEQMLSLPNLENHRTWKKKFPTPQASDCRDRGNLSNPSIQRRMEIGKQVNLSMCVSADSGKLNPMWVEWLMGWPLGWTDLRPLETDKYHLWQQQHGKN
jgi:hypothetical protein